MASANARKHAHEAMDQQSSDAKVLNLGMLRTGKSGKQPIQVPTAAHRTRQKSDLERVTDHNSCAKHTTGANMKQGHTVRK